MAPGVDDEKTVSQAQLKLKKSLRNLIRLFAGQKDCRAVYYVESRFQFIDFINLGILK